MGNVVRSCLKRKKGRKKEIRKEKKRPEIQFAPRFIQSRLLPCFLSKCGPSFLLSGYRVQAPAGARGYLLGGRPRRRSGCWGGGRGKSVSVTRERDLVLG